MYILLIRLRNETLERSEKKDYQKPEIIQHENLNEVTQGSVTPPASGPEAN